MTTPSSVSHAHLGHRHGRLHRPGFEVGQNAIRALSSVVGPGPPRGIIWPGTGPTPTASPSDFQLPARALGFNLVLDYRINQLGLQDTFAGMIQVDGNWYCPGCPRHSSTPRWTFGTR